MLVVYDANNVCLRSPSESIHSEKDEPESREAIQSMLAEMAAAIESAISKLNEMPAEQAKSEVFELIVPQMNSLLALHVSWNQAQCRLIDLIDRDPSLMPLMTSGKNAAFMAKEIAVYSKFASESGDPWAMAIVDKARYLSDNILG